MRAAGEAPVESSAPGGQGATTDVERNKQRKDWMTVIGKALRLGALLAVGLGCAPVEYVPPEPVLPEGPLSIQAAIELAYLNNPDVTASQERLLAARAAISEASSYYWPVLRLIERYTQTNSPSQAFGSILDQRAFSPALDFNDPGKTSNFHTGVAGSITLYDGGRRRARVERAEAQALSEGARLETVRRDLALEVARAFYLIHKARDAAATQETALAALTQHLRVARARLEEGAARRSDVLALEVRIAETRESVIVARSSAARAEAGLHVLLGLSVSDPVDVERPTDEEPAAREELPRLLERARKSRFELVEAQGRLREAQARLKEVWAGYFPEVTLLGSFGFDDESLALSHSSWTWGLSFLEDIFDALRTPQRVRQALAGLRAAHAAYRKSLLEVELAVSDATLDADEADARLAVAEETAQLATESARLVTSEYAEGAADVTELLDGELALAGARTRLGAARFDRALSRVAISHAIGEYPAPPEVVAADGARLHTPTER